MGDAREIAAGRAQSCWRRRIATGSTSSQGSEEAPELEEGSQSRSPSGGGRDRSADAWWRWHQRDPASEGSSALDRRRRERRGPREHGGDHRRAPEEAPGRDAHLGAEAEGSRRGAWRRKRRASQRRRKRKPQSAAGPALGAEDAEAEEGDTQGASGSLPCAVAVASAESAEPPEQAAVVSARVHAVRQGRTVAPTRFMFVHFDNFEFVSIGRRAASAPPRCGSAMSSRKYELSVPPQRDHGEWRATLRTRRRTCWPESRKCGRRGRSPQCAAVRVTALADQRVGCENIGAPLAFECVPCGGDAPAPQRMQKICFLWSSCQTPWRADGARAGEAPAANMVSCAAVLSRDRSAAGECVFNPIGPQVDACDVAGQFDTHGDGDSQAAGGNGVLIEPCCDLEACLEIHCGTEFCGPRTGEGGSHEDFLCADASSSVEAHHEQNAVDEELQVAATQSSRAASSRADRARAVVTLDIEARGGAAQRVAEATTSAKADAGVRAAVTLDIEARDGAARRDAEAAASALADAAARADDTADSVARDGAVQRNAEAATSALRARPARGCCSAADGPRPPPVAAGAPGSDACEADWFAGLPPPPTCNREEREVLAIAVGRARMVESQIREAEEGAAANLSDISRRLEHLIGEVKHNISSLQGCVARGRVAALSAKKLSRPRAKGAAAKKRDCQHQHWQNEMAHHQDTLTWTRDHGEILERLQRRLAALVEK